MWQNTARSHCDLGQLKRDWQNWQALGIFFVRSPRRCFHSIRADVCFRIDISLDTGRSFFSTACLFLTVNLASTNPEASHVFVLAKAFVAQQQTPESTESPMSHNRKLWILISVVFSFSIATFAQSEVQEFTLVLNGQSGRILVYRINGQAFVDVEALARIGNGSATIEGHQLILTLPAPSTPTPASPSRPEGMTRSFMTAALKDLAIIRDWHTTIAHALQRGVPGDGSRLVVFHDRAVEGLRLATVEAATHSDQDALRLLTNHFNQVDRWKHKLVDARKSMSTANYSITPDALERDSEYQTIASCSQFLSGMLAGGRYEDSGSCH